MKQPYTVGRNSFGIPCRIQQRVATDTAHHRQSTVQLKSQTNIAVTQSLQRLPRPRETRGPLYKRVYLDARAVIATAVVCSPESGI